MYLYMYAYMCVHMWRIDNSIIGFPLCHLSVNSESNNSANSRDSPAFASPVLGTRYVPLSLAFNVDGRNLNLGSHDCVVSIYQLSPLLIHCFDFSR